MFNAFDTDTNENKKINGTNPFDSSTDPFGISNTMKISESSEKFDDNPFNTQSTNDTSIRPRSGKEALSSSNWLAYQHSMDEAHLDSIEDLHETSLISQTTTINLNNPFLVSTMSNNTTFPTDFPISNKTSKNPFDIFDDNPSVDDPFGLNQSKISSSANAIFQDNFTDASKFHLPSGSEKSISEAAFSHPISMGMTPQASSNTSGAQITSDSKLNNQYLDWFAQSEEFLPSNDSKTIPKIDSNPLKNTSDSFGYGHRPPQSLATLSMSSRVFRSIESLGFFLEENSQENVPSPPMAPKKQLIHRTSIDDVPSIRIDEPTTEHNESNIVPQGYFDKAKKIQSEDDSDEETKMVFKIGEKKVHTTDDFNMPIPILLPPPPSSSSKISQNVSDDADSSSSSETDHRADDDDDDPLAIFRSKSVKKSTETKHGKNLITDWDEEEPTYVEEKQPSVCLMFVYLYSLLSRKSPQG